MGYRFGTCDQGQVRYNGFMKIKFMGAIGEVTGSSYLLTTDGGETILIDLGMFQGSAEVSKLNQAPLAFEATRLSGALLTHAHLDHCGRLPLVVKAGYSGPVYMTPATRELVELQLEDTMKVAKERQAETGEEPLFNEDDVDKLVGLIKTVGYDQNVEVGGVSVTFKDAGHILGSASIEIRGQNSEIRTVVFSGDLGNSPEDLIRPTELIKSANVVVMESTYGDRLHTLEDPKMIIQQEINEVEKTGGTLLIPAFSLERTQEVLHIIDHLKKSGRVRTETLVFMDSPLAEKATEIFKKHTELYNKELAEHAKIDDPFDFPGLTVVAKGWQSRKIAEVNDRPKVIIAGSGMMTGGRIMNHAAVFLPQEKTRVLIVGFMAVNTLGRRLVEGAKSVTIGTTNVDVRANIRVTTVMSAHADQAKLLEWLGKIKGVKKVFLTHGEDTARAALSGKIKGEGVSPEVIIPKMNEEIEI